MEIVKHDQLQMISVADAKSWYDKFVAFSQGILKKDLDYGIIPGTNKPSLYKAGAEKLKLAYGLGAEFECTDKTVQFEPFQFIDYSYKCVIKTREGMVLAECEGSCNSMEEKYRYQYKLREIPPEKEEALKLKIDKKGKWTKQDNKWYWLDRIDNQEVFNKKNTFMKMAQKRAFVGALLLATGASEFYTQDIDNLDPGEEGIKPADTYAEEVKDEEREPLDPLWSTLLEECKTPEDVDKKALENKEAILKDPRLRQLFNQRKDKLKKPTPKDLANRGTAHVEELLSKGDVTKGEVKK